MFDDYDALKVCDKLNSHNPGKLPGRDQLCCNLHSVLSFSSPKGYIACQWRIEPLKQASKVTRGAEKTSLPFHKQFLSVIMEHRSESNHNQIVEIVHSKMTSIAAFIMILPVPPEA